MTSQPDEQSQCYQVAGCFFDLIGRVIGQAEKLAHEIGIPMPFIKALQNLDSPLAMKDLGRRMHCDPSFVTMLADMLEKRGLARREPHPADRRVKNLVLTEDGVALKRRIESEISMRMPWTTALDSNERAQLLALLRKMLSADAHDGAAAGADPPEAMSGQLASLLASALQEGAPPGREGEVTRAVSTGPAAG